MSRNKDWSFIYWIFRHWVKFSFSKIYYREVYVNNIENIPPDSPIIFAPNHQNALLDPLCLVATIKQQPFFLARQDFFKTKLIRKFFSMIKMIPVYRIRDGIGNLQKNEEIFRNCADILGRNNCLGIMIEGDHVDKKRLRTFGKGVVRVAFASEEIKNNKLGLKVIPVGLEYKDVNKFRSRLLINFGKAISVSDYYSVYKENPQKGYKALNEKIRKELISLMIHIETDEIYDLILRLREYYNQRMRDKLEIKSSTYFSVFQADKKLVEIFENSYIQNPEKIDFLTVLSEKYSEGLKKLNFRDHVIGRQTYSFLYLFLSFIYILILSPFMIFGIINNYLPFKIPTYIGKRETVHNKFISSINYALSFLLLFPVFYLIIFIIVLLISGNILITVVYLILSAVTGLLSIHHWFDLEKFIARMRYNRLKRNKNKELIELMRYREEIFQLTDELVDSCLKQ